MTASPANLKEKIAALEKRVARPEKEAAGKIPDPEKEFEKQLYEKAKSIVIREKKASVIFLQRKLVIDYHRAEKILKLLESEGIVGPEIGVGRRRVFK
ncbi:MAG TPA: DNA translocase FtsK [Candidatus Woesebacteria bacterium]|nr:DNA translocase FtsK [Candidatus Woesebacteria bacterium]